MKEVRIPTIIVVREFNVEHIKCKNNQCLYLKQSSRNAHDVEMDIDLEHKAKLVLCWSNIEPNLLRNLRFQKHDPVLRDRRPLCDQ